MLHLTICLSLINRYERPVCLTRNWLQIFITYITWQVPQLSLEYRKLLVFIDPIHAACFCLTSTTHLVNFSLCILTYWTVSLTASNGFTADIKPFIVCAFTGYKFEQHDNGNITIYQRTRRRTKCHILSRFIYREIVQFLVIIVPFLCQ